MFIIYSLLLCLFIMFYLFVYLFFMFIFYLLLFMLLLCLFLFWFKSTLKWKHFCEPFRVAPRHCTCCAQWLSWTWLWEGKKSQGRAKLKCIQTHFMVLTQTKKHSNLHFLSAGRYESWEAVWVDGMWDSGGLGFALPCKLCLAASTWGAQAQWGAWGEVG